MAVLRVDHLTKSFTSGMWPFSTPHTYTAVNDISFNLNKGETLGFLGPNGAGKTTTIQMLLGTLTPTSGSISYFDKDFRTQRAAILQKIGYASGYEKFPARLTILDNLEIVGRIYGLSAAERRERITSLLKRFDIWDKRNHPTASLSAGQSTRVMLAKAFIANPPIVLLDEPTASLDPDVANEVRAFILAHRAEHNTSILITSHNMNEVTELCDRVLVLKNGSIIANATPAQLAQSTSLVRVHLTIASFLEEATHYFATTPWHYTVQGTTVVVEIDEHAIADLLKNLSSNHINYSQISIDKPTLEDYFLSIAK